MNKLLVFATIALGITLPFQDQFSTIAMALILACGLAQQFLSEKPAKIGTLKPFLLIAVLLILPRITGLFYGQWDNATKELLRSAPLVVIPLSLLLLSKHERAHQIRRWFFYGLLIGITLLAIVCYYPVVTTMISEQQPLSYLLRWRYMNFNFTSPLEDGHPAYLGLLICWLLAHIFFTQYLKSQWRPVVGLLLTTLLFQLVARNALLVAGILWLIYIMKTNIRWLQLSAVGLLLLCVGAVVLHPSNYLKDKFFYIFSEEAKARENTRFDRLEASFEVFKDAPIFGPGPGEDNELRMQAYKTMGEEIAFQNNYNAHNQFVEFLSTFGLYGLCCFLLAIFLITRLLWRSKNWLDFYLWIGILVAMITESLLERSLGVKYMSILVAFILLNQLISKREDHLSDGRRS
ncbi:O-antigen ligase family protein [Gilvibacter sediminis]|uniref:O-antigen ligase family protein n=1 Tax=Gilvibacter sediminis TaxID=379071 RepID=UPI00234FFC05|nr:O-antigen ligase family protein [Gilvibacter sediminis]MDC7996787.1 O-antigen ligase family protein [Gilvibacter sediminis]